MVSFIRRFKCFDIQRSHESLLWCSALQGHIRADDVFLCYQCRICEKRATSKVLNLDTQMQLFQFIALVGVKHQQFLLMEFHKDANNWEQQCLTLRQKPHHRWKWGITPWESGPFRPELTATNTVWLFPKQNATSSSLILAPCCCPCCLICQRGKCCFLWYIDWQPWHYDFSFRKWLDSSPF